MIKVATTKATLFVEVVLTSQQHHDAMLLLRLFVRYNGDHRSYVYRRTLNIVRLHQSLNV